MKIILNVIIALMPWCIKRKILIKVYKYKLHKKAYIGFSYAFPKYLEMDEYAIIGHLNVVVNLDKVSIGKNSIIWRNNWITGFPSGTNSKHYNHQKDRLSELIIGEETSITKLHHIDCTNSVIVGNYVTIAGYSTQILTHSVNIIENRQDSKPIVIGNYSFIGSRSIILGGGTLPNYSVLAAGAVLNKNLIDEYTLYGGIPAKPIKSIPKNAKYFIREKGFIY